MIEEAARKHVTVNATVLDLIPTRGGCKVVYLYFYFFSINIFIRSKSSDTPHAMPQKFDIKWRPSEPNVKSLPISGRGLPCYR